MSRRPALNAPNTYSLYTLTQVQELNIGIPVVVRNPTTGKFKLTIRLQSSSDLINYQPLLFTGEGTAINGQGQIEFEFTPPSVPSYYRVKSK